MDVPAPVPFRASSSEQLRSTFSEHGFARITGTFSAAEVERLRDVVDDLMANPPDVDNLTWRSVATGGGSIVQRISRANLFSASVAAEFLHAKQLSTIGSWIFNVSPERVHIADGTEGSDGIVFVIKDPRNQSVHRDLRWHRDERFTRQLPINPFVNCGLYLDPSDVSRGGLIVLPRSHPLSHCDAVEETILEVSGQVCVSAEPGDVVVHGADVWHRSGSHFVMGEVRRVIYANLYAR